MRTYLFLFAAIFSFYFVPGVVAQNMCDTFLVSANFDVQERRDIRIWTPEISKTDSITNIVYVFDTNYCFDVIAANVSYLYHIAQSIPPTAVVGVCYGSGGRMDVGLDLDSFRLKKTGKSFLKYVSEEVMPLVKEKMNVQSCHSIFLGHSYLADYGIFCLKSYPGIFDSYVLLAPEVIPIPSFEYDLSSKRVYLAAASKDAEQRIETASAIFDVLTDHTKKPVLKFDIFNDHSHMSIVPVGGTSGIQFIFRDFISSNNIDEHIDTTKTIKDNYHTIISSNALSYRYGIQNDANIISYLCHSKDVNKDDFEWVLERMPPTNANHHEIIGFIYYTRLKAYELAEKYLFKSIDMYIEENKQNFMNNTYRGLIDVYNAQNASPEKIDQTYADAIEKMPKRKDWFYLRGKASIEKDYQISNGLIYLQEYISNYEELTFKRPLEVVYYYMALGYHKTGDHTNAQSWLQRALELDPDYEDAIALAEKLKNRKYNEQ